LSSPSVSSPRSGRGHSIKADLDEPLAALMTTVHACDDVMKVH